MIDRVRCEILGFEGGCREGSGLQIVARCSVRYLIHT